MMNPLDDKPQYLKAPYHYTDLNQMIYRKVYDFGDQRVLDVRANGYLTGSGEKALGLDLATAHAEQDRFGRWVTAVMNEAANDVVSIPRHDLLNVLKGLPEGSDGHTILKAALGLHTDADLQVKWSPRGIGTDHGIPSLVDGVAKEYGESPGLSGFVFSRAEGELAVKIFGGRAYLDWRNSEPGWIQVKVHAPRPVLHELSDLVRANNNMLTPAIVAAAVKKAPIDAEV